MDVAASDRLVRNGRPYFGGLHDSFFELLPFLPAGRMLDVGAAVGHFTTVMRRFSPASPVTAFEPFSGNAPHFRKAVGDDPHVTFIPKAVMDFDGTANLHVPHVVSAEPGQYANYAGFSSVGSVLRPGDQREAMVVETCAIDSVVDEHVIVMKIDVQGAEIDVLRGAAKLIAGPGVDFIFIEFGGDKDVLNFVLDAGYRVFSTDYVIFTRENPDLSGWDIESERVLSTGRRSHFGWPKQPPVDADLYCDFFLTERRKVGAFITDLVCVHARVLPLFEPAAEAARRVRAERSIAPGYPVF